MFIGKSRSEWTRKVEKLFSVTAIVMKIKFILYVNLKYKLY